MDGLKEKKEEKEKRKEKGFIWTISINVSANSHVKSFYDHQKKKKFVLFTCNKWQHLEKNIFCCL
jgi:hypothetical protein